MLWEVALLFFFFIEIKELLCFLKVLMLDNACTGSFAYDDLHSVLIIKKKDQAYQNDGRVVLSFFAPNYMAGRIHY